MEKKTDWWIIFVTLWFLVEAIMYTVYVIKDHDKYLTVFPLTMQNLLIWMGIIHLYYKENE